MRWLLVSLIGVSGFVVGSGVLADVEFGDDEIQSGMNIQSVTVPGGGQPVGDGASEQYKKALQGVMQKGSPAMINQLVESGNELEPSVSPKEVIHGVEELPFTLLSVSLDRDQDGLGDGDEIRLATDPNNPDTDNDGYIDSLEVIRRYNPLVAGPGDKIEYKEPIGQTDSLYRITGIRLTEDVDGQKLTVTGTGPNNALVAILVFSTENKTWVTRTDQTGRFLFVSADALDPGEYKAYASAVSANGLPLAFSKKLTFERTVNSLIKAKELSKEVITADEEEGSEWGRLGILVSAGALVVAMGAVGLIWIRRRKNKKREIQL